MAETLTHLTAQQYTLTGTVAITVTDQGGVGRTCTVNTGGPNHYRTFLAPAAGTGTEDSPYELLGTIEAALNNLGTYWAVSLRSTGLVRIQYLGTGTGTLTLPNTLRYLLGWDSGTVGPLNTNDTADAAYHPTHCVFSIAFTDDSGWTRRAQKTALASLPSGKVYGWTDRQAGGIRRGSWAFLPRDETTRDDYNTANPTDPMLGTAAYGGEGVMGQAADPDQVPPWGALTQLNNQCAQRCGVAWDNLQDLISASPGAAYDVCSLTPAGVAGAQLAPAAPNWAARWTVSGLEFDLVAQNQVI